MAHRLLRDAQADGWERSDFPIICESCLGDNPYVRMARAGIDYESSYGKVRPNDTILKLQRTTPYYKRNRAHVCSFYARGECTRGAECPYRHEMPVTGELSQQNIKDRYYGVNDPVAVKLLSKAGEMPSLTAPEDESIKTLYVGGLDARITEQDLRDHFYAHGEIESIRMVLQRACAFVTYTTREGAEKAAEELANKLVIKGLRLKLMWGKPQASKPEGEVPDDEAARQGLMAHGGMLPRAVISQQQSNQQPQPPGTQDQQQPPLHYFNIPAPPPVERTFYPSMDPQRMGALIPSQEASDGKGGSEKQPQQQGLLRAPNSSGQAYPVLPPHLQSQYPQYYPPYGYMAPPRPPPPYQQQYSPYQSMMVPPPPPPAMQQYPPGASGSSSQG
ncbi:putative zinc finger CCCH domain-containing protein 40 [Cocos nucifera]|uniref:Putative zinc finger CCCH domain-containing protein 40 n=1 Tax=Cocos nucifera TaxID=13894 RepID=A0A8K0NAN8_COCNU|nr:putative zinc finger CCCH domain-containing protein 40 [Cocos nucifera]